jgi:hypothetical protein
VWGAGKLTGFHSSANPPQLAASVIAARQILGRVKERFGLQPLNLAADKSYGTGEFLAWLCDRQIAPHIPVLGSLLALI